MEEKNIVYITIHGEKYHRIKNCLFILMKKPYPITLEKAKTQGKEPCKATSTFQSISR